MTDDQSIWTEVLKSIAASTTLAAAAWGAAGGMTSALSVRVEKAAVLRQVLLGALVAGGTGTAGAALVAYFLGVPTETIPLAGVGGSSSYLVGVFGPAIVEVLLSRIGRGDLPRDGGRDE